MRLVKLIIVMCTVLLSSFAVAGDVSAVNTKGLLSKEAIKGYDPVAYWKRGEPQKGLSKYTVEWRGATWQFSTEVNRQLFKNDPAKYAPQYGGYCAWAMADGAGRAVKINPNAWTIYKDKLYLNYNLKVTEEWLKTKDQDITVADRNYPNLTDVSNYR